MGEKRKYNKFHTQISYESGEIGKEEGGLNLTDTIKQSYSNLESVFDSYKLSSDFRVQLKSYKKFDEYFQEVVNKINNNEISSQLVQDEKYSYHIQRSKGCEIIPFWLSCVYAELANKSEQASDISTGWSLAAHSCYYVGLSTAAREIDVFKSEFHKRHKQASKASNARDRSHEPVKREAIRLLQDLAPKGGWKTKKSAIEGIEDELHHYIKANGVKLASSENIDSNALVEWLNKWINMDLAMKDALEANMRKRHS